MNSIPVTASVERATTPSRVPTHSIAKANSSRRAKPATAEPKPASIRQQEAGFEYARFERGLTRLLDGIELDLERRGKPA
jgi:hypothetical protein